jgi:hypothetical protein
MQMNVGNFTFYKIYCQDNNHTTLREFMAYCVNDRRTV